MKKFTLKEKNTILKVRDANEKLLSNLYSTIIEYEKNEITEQKFSFKLEQIYSTYNNDINEFFTVFKTNNKLNTLKECLTEIKNSLTEIKNFCKIKYNLVNISVKNHAFLEFFN